ncbi:MAG: hemolysin III family protein [Terriglobia bacterium]
MTRPLRNLTSEDVASVLTHGIGLMLSVAGLCVLVALSVLYGTRLHVLSCGLYGVTLVSLYAASTLYHSFQSPRVKHVLKIIDHCSIYLLIAGTYTPFTLVLLHGGWGWTLFGLVWGLSVFGIVFKILFVNRFKVTSVSIYLLMGWMAVVAIKPMLALVPTGGVRLLFAGGLIYTAGILFYVWKKIPYNHAIWHLFVLAGSACHYFAVMFYVLPRKS